MALTLRLVKGTALTYQELDDNFLYLSSSIGSSSGTPGGSNTQIQFNSGSTFSGSVALRFIYTSQSLEQGESVQAIGQYSHAEGTVTTAGMKTAYSASVVNGIVTMSAAYGPVASNFPANDRLYLYDTPFQGYYNKAVFTISQSYYNAPNTIVELYDTNVNTATAYVVNVSVNSLQWAGDQTIPGDYAHAEGEGTYAIGNFSHTEGTLAAAIGNYSHAEGNLTRAIGENSHAQGQESQAIGYASHAEGERTKAVGSNSHAEGNQAQAIGNDSHAEGGFTQAIGNGSHAEGSLTVALGDYSHTAGWNSVASGEYQSVIGQFNISSSAQSAFIIGNGADNNNRSNLLFAQGNTVQITGSLDVSGSGRFTGGLEIVSSSGLTFGGGVTALNYIGQELYIGSSPFWNTVRMYSNGVQKYNQTTTLTTISNTTINLSTANVQLGGVGVIKYTANDLQIGSVDTFFTTVTEYVSGSIVGRKYSNGNYYIGSNPVDSGFKLDVSGSGRFTGGLTVTGSATITNVLTLPYQDPLPTSPATGSIALSGSGATFVGMFVWTGAWTQI